MLYASLLCFGVVGLYIRRLIKDYQKRSSKTTGHIPHYEGFVIQSDGVLDMIPSEHKSFSTRV